MKCVAGFTALLFALLTLGGCASPSAGVKNASPAAISSSLSLDYIVVQTFSSLPGSTDEQHSLADAVISGLNDTGLFTTVSTNLPALTPVNGVKIQADIQKIKKVSDDARNWAGTMAGQAVIEVHVTVSDLNSRQIVETFDVEGKSGKSAWAGTTEAAVQLAASQIVAEVVKINAKTAGKP